MLFDDLVLTDQLFPHLYDVQEITEKRVEVIMAGLLEKNPAPDKETDAMAWVRHMNLLKAMAESHTAAAILSASTTASGTTSSQTDKKQPAKSPLMPPKFFIAMR